VASIEGAHFIASGNLEMYSEQQLVDCCGRLYACFGCNGGMPYRAFHYLETHDAMYRSSYPYTAKDGTCQYKDNTGVKVAQRYEVTASDLTEMKKAASQQPISVAIQADQTVFQAY